jgi:mannose-6-phosphate isomerase-like protein (cupin superfamily)
MVYSRRHAELIDTSLLAWAPVAGAAAPGGAVVEHKLLSRDPEDGASTAILRLPPGFEHRSSWAIDTAFDAFVLSGSVAVGDDQLDRYCYTFRPAGYPCGPVATAGGADVLVMTYGELRPCAPDAGELANPRAVPRLPLSEVTVRQPLTDKVGLGLVSQTLRMEDSGERVFVTSVQEGGFSDHRIEWHPCIEEIYTLEGEGSMDHPDDTMVMRPGCYCFRPAGVPHGPFHTISLPKLALIRVDRTLVNNYCSPDEARVMWRAFQDLDPQVAARIERAPVG